VIPIATWIMLYPTLKTMVLRSVPAVTLTYRKECQQRFFVWRTIEVFGREILLTELVPLIFAVPFAYVVELVIKSAELSPANNEPEAASPDGT
jgi:hypothetical protein